jgi:hypothetical protein
LWVRGGEITEEAKLAVRKVVWRALVEGLLGGERAKEGEEGEGVGKRKRLGKLNSRIYNDWDTFLTIARSRLSPNSPSPSPSHPSPERNIPLENQLSALHVLRCLIGVGVESLIVRDRGEFVRVGLERGRRMGRGGEGEGEGGKEGEEGEKERRCEILCLFGQEEGSPRNLAIVVWPPGSR